MEIKNIQKATTLLAEWHEIRLFLEKFKEHAQSKNILINELEYKPPFKNKFSDAIVPKLNEAIKQVFEDAKKEMENYLATL